MSTAVADPPVVAAAPVAAAAPSPVPAAGSPAGAVVAGLGAGAAAPAPAPGGSDANAPAAAAKPDAAAAAKPAIKALLGDEPAKPDAAAEPAKPEAKADAWALEVPKDGPLSAEDVKGLETFAKAEGLSKAQAEKVLAREAAGRTASAAAMKAQVDEAANTFAALTEKDAEIGGAKLPETVAAAKRVLVANFTPEQRAQIVASPFGNHPLFLKALALAAKGLPAEDAIHADNGGRDAVASNPAHDIYGARAKR